ncbi:MAG: hypothetical protein GY724_02230, partial [Actinomycetia bacterium]|nr:hypothetical protein [Actinomycetes bacterium]
SDAITVADAQQALEEAGLMEEVLELLTENPDVMGLVSGPGPVGVTLATSSDGIDWVDLDASNLPVDATNFSAVASDGHHLVIVGQQWEPDMSRRSTNSLFTTDDLVTWQSHEFPSEPELELPQYVHSDTYVGSVAVGPNGWVALSQTNTWIDEQMLLPAEALDLADSWGTSIDSNGITIEEWAEPDYVLDENGNIDDAATDWDCCNESIAEHHYTWEELGITLDEYQSYMGSPGQSVVWSATWGESPQQSTLPGEGWGGAVAATDTGYLTMVHGNRRGATLYSSANGLDWVRADG